MYDEIKRQLVHAFFGTVLILLIIYFGRIITLEIACLAFSTGIVLSVLVKRGVKLPVIDYFVEKCGRKQEKHFPGYGAIIFFLGMIIILFFFQDLNVIIGAMVVAVYGDAASTIMGKSFGRYSIVKPYTIEGTVAGIIVSFATLVLFLNPLSAFVTALIGMSAEMLPIDDNLSIPIVSAVVLTLLI